MKLIMESWRKFLNESQDDFLNTLGKDVIIEEANGASSLIVKPAIAFCSCIRRGIRIIHAAIPPGPLAKPPIPKTTTGRILIIMINA